MRSVPPDWRNNADYAYIGRGSIWGNPYSYFEGTKAAFIVKDRTAAIAAYKEWIMHGAGAHLLALLHTLKGKKLICYCSPKACHGDVLVAMIEGEAVQAQTTLF